jgi:hypothetical protein
LLGKIFCFLLIKKLIIDIFIRYPRTIIRTDLVDGHLYLVKKSCLDIAIRSKYSSFRKEFLPKMIRQMATNQSLEDLISTPNQKKMMMRQKSSFCLILFEIFI